MQHNPTLLTRFLTFIFFLLILPLSLLAQPASDSLGRPVTDTTKRVDTAIVPAPVRLDTLSRKPVADSAWRIGQETLASDRLFTWQVLQHHAWFDFHTPAGKPLSADADLHVAKGKDLLFYVLIALILSLALLRQAFPKYFNDLFRVFFRTTLKQRQIREQLMQTTLPSLLLNVVFVWSAGLYLAFIVEYFKLNPFEHFWILFFYCGAGLTAAYFIKFTGLRMAGWLFSVKQLAQSYIFIVFIINKMIGLLLVPFLVILAFATGQLYQAGIALSACLLGLMLLYRIFLTFAILRNEVRIGLFHFVLYVAAFEIAPLLLVYKALLLYFRITA